MLFGFDARMRFFALPFFDWVTLSLMCLNLRLFTFKMEMVYYTYVISANKMMHENP